MRPQVEVTHEISKSLPELQAIRLEEEVGCGDCGATDYEPSPHRSDVCLSCWDLRMLLVNAMHAKTIDQDEFTQLQKVIASRNGKGVAATRRVLGLP